uniref:Uncharacterized protein n=1 Tax=Noccaea caerulescens TaxID=107243 RepID=A0A1J3IKI7_NOCCA
MECELDASPAVSLEASVEATAHVKVIAASYVPSGSDILDDSTVEAPLTINIPYSLPSESPWSSRGMNITFPVCLQKATSTEGMNGILAWLFGRKGKNGLPRRMRSCLPL